MKRDETLPDTYNAKQYTTTLHSNTVVCHEHHINTTRQDVDDDE